MFQYGYQVKKKEAGEILFRDLDFETLDGFLKWVETERGCSVSTRNPRFSALSAFAAYAQNRNFEAATVFANAVKRIPVKKRPVLPRTTFSLDEASVLLRLPDPEKRLGFRDQILLNLMYASGARAQEICDLKVRDFFMEKNLYKLTITEKGNKSRRIVVARPCGILPKRYLERPELFLEKCFTPHTMRHTTAAHMLEAGVPIMAIKNFLGHSSISTTDRYAGLSEIGATLSEEISWKAF